MIMLSGDGFSELHHVTPSRSRRAARRRAEQDGQAPARMGRVTHGPGGSLEQLHPYAKRQRQSERGGEHERERADLGPAPI